MSEHFSINPRATGGVFNQRTKVDTVRDSLQRQARGEVTRAQVMFDIAMGVVLPILCLVFDPLVFRAGMSGQPLAGGIQLLAYVFIAVEIVALAAWLGIGARAGEWCGVLAGIMYAGALFSVLVGICLLPFSVIGLIFIVGALGFTPFLTAFIYLRNARRAHKAAGAQMPRAGLKVTLFFGVTLALAAPVFAHWQLGQLINSSIMEVLSEDEAQAKAAARRLRYAGWFDSAELNQMVIAYGSEKDPRRKERLARAYYEITGGSNIESRWNMLAD